MSRKRSISALLNENPRKKQKKTKVICNCDKCNGSLVDRRTNLSHKYRQKKEKNQNSTANQEFIFQFRTRKAALNRIMPFDTDQHNSTIDRITNSDDAESNDNVESIESFESDDIFEDYSAPAFELPSYSDDIFEDYLATAFELPSYSDDIFTDSRFMWILLWIMNFRMKFNLSNTATEALIKFMKLVLIKIGGTEFEDICGSLYTTRKFLGLSDQFVNFVACRTCHKLYRKENVVNFQQNNQPSIMKCTHVEFPNSTTRRSCNTPLSIQSRSLNGNIINRPELIFPYASIRQQLIRMYQHSNFESNLRHWIDRSNINDILGDIYDGDIWKTFKSSTFGNNSEPFFNRETADSHLGLILNVDWFQPYSNVTHSTGVIYAAIANLPREIRFKRENMLILGILPGPNEANLHKINHYLSPIVDELKLLWQGIMLDSTAEYSEGKKIRAALILVSCDIPAARKVCGHISALVSCHRCNKKANYVNNKHNFGGMRNMNEWFVSKDSAIHRQNAIEWRHCNSNSA
jgi:hypothetical protein